MEWRKDNPIAIGKYVIKTKTSAGAIHKVDAMWNGKSWGISNQIFQEWLDESNYDEVMICVAVVYGEARKVCDDLEGKRFDSHAELQAEIASGLGDSFLSDEDEEKLLIYNVEDFCLDANDDLFNMDSYFVSRVYIRQY